MRQNLHCRCKRLIHRLHVSTNRSTSLKIACAGNSNAQIFPINRFWMAASSAKWSCGRSPSSLVCGQLLTIWNIVWRLPHWQLSLVARPRVLWQDAQWHWLVRKWFIFDQYRRGRLNPGCRIVGSSTREELTTEADFQSSCHWLMTSMGWVSVCPEGSAWWQTVAGRR